MDENNIILKVGIIEAGDSKIIASNSELIIDLSQQIGAKLILSNEDFDIYAKKPIKSTQAPCLLLSFDLKFVFDKPNMFILLNSDFFSAQGYYTDLSKIDFENLVETIKESNYLRSYLMLEYHKLLNITEASFPNKILYFKWLTDVSNTLYSFVHETFLLKHSGNSSVFLYEEAEAIRLLELEIRNNLAMSMPSVKEMAFKVHMSQSKFKSMFKSIYNESPHQHFLNLKLGIALTLLKNGKMNLTQISYQLGFSHPSAITRLFNSKMGTTPTHLAK
jgi:AraC-like DNA-binding protein